MVPLTSLWLPILLSGVLVLVLSSIIHMFLPWHRTDFRKVPDEDGAMAALRALGIPPGDYILPCAGGPEEMKSPEFKAKFEKGPVVVMTVMPKTGMAVGGSMVKWFLYSLVVAVFAAYVAGRAVGPGGDYLAVFRFAGVTTFASYSLALWPMSFWYKRSWTTALKSSIDGLVYALATAGIFGWLWP
jgi:hypothetical protein